MPEAGAPIVVELRMPADPAMSRVLRLAAAGVASLGGLSLDEIDDVKVAVSEALLALVEHADGGQIDVHLAVDSDGFTVHARAAAGTLDSTHPDLLLCRVVLDGVCAENGVEVVDGGAHIWARVAHAPAG